MTTTTTTTGWKIIAPTIFTVSRKKSCNDYLHISITNHQTARRTVGAPQLQEPGPVTKPPTIPLQQPPPPYNKNNNNKKKKKKKIRSSSSSSTATATVTDILRLMDSLQFPIPTDVYASFLKECTDLRDAEGGAEVHAHINRARRCRGAGGRHRPLPGLRLDNRILLMYASCGRLDAARQVFDKMAIKDSFSWMTMIAGHVDNDDPAEALHLFEQMLQRQNRKGYELTSLIIPCILKACINTNNLEFGKQVHGWVLKMMGRRTSCGDGCSREDYSFLHGLFIVFYGKFKCSDSARRVFDQICHRDTVMWTAMIVEYSRGEQFEKAIEVFKEMGKAGSRKNNFTFSSVLRACGRIGDAGWCGRQVHADAIKRGMASEFGSSFVRTSLVDMYGKSGLLKDARMVFEETTVVSSYKKQRNEVCWNAMLNGYTQQGYHNEAIKLLYLMKAAGLQPPESTVIQLRMACGGSS